MRFTEALKSPTAYETLDRVVLQPRLLLCLHGIGTNAGLQRMAALESGVTYADSAALGAEARSPRPGRVVAADLGAREPVRPLRAGYERPDTARLTQMAAGDTTVGSTPVRQTVSASILTGYHHSEVTPRSTRARQQ